MRSRGLQIAQRDVVKLSGGKAVLQQNALPIFLPLGADHLGFGRGDRRLCRLHAVARGLVVETGDHIAFLNRRSDIDRPLDNLAVDAKTEVGLGARLDVAGLRQSLADVDRRDRDRAHRADRLRLFLRLIAASQQHQDQRQDKDKATKPSCAHNIPTTREFDLKILDLQVKASRKVV